MVTHKFFLPIIATGILIIVATCGKNLTGPNSSPRITSLTASQDTVIAPTYDIIVCSAVDDDNDHLIYDWGYAPGGTFVAANGNNNSDTVYYQPAPCCSGPQIIKCTVTDGKGGLASDSITIFTNVYP